MLTLKQKGFDNAAAILGGMDAWKQAGYPMATGDPVKPQPTQPQAQAKRTRRHRH